VLSTLHTNDCPSTVARLLDMGIPPFLVSSSLMLILAQRLGRRVCKDCKQPYEADEEMLVPYGHISQGLARSISTKARAARRATSRHEGSRAIYEVMPISQELRDLMIRNAPPPRFARRRRAGHENTAAERAAESARGMMTIEEVLRVTLG